MGTPFLSEVKIVAFNFPPKGWAFCNGQQLPINQNQALFSLCGTMYGGNGQTTFALPDLRGRTPIHVGAGFTQGESGGKEFHTLIASEMPAHTHIASAKNGQANSATPKDNFWGGNFGNSYGTAPGSSGPATTSAGGAQPHENRQPFLVVNFIIALQGVFPSHN